MLGLVDKKAARAFAAEVDEVARVGMFSVRLYGGRNLGLCGSEPEFQSGGRGTGPGPVGQEISESVSKRGAKPIGKVESVT
jgi:hypothetical protein